MNWLSFQARVFGAAEGLVATPSDTGRPFHGLADGDDAADVIFGRLGYADAARSSYAIFARLREEGAIPAGVRFQVSFPTPLAVVATFVRAEDRAALEGPYTDALLGEVAEICASIPHGDLAIQWDVAVEVAILEGRGYAASEPFWQGDAVDGVTARLVADVDAVPEDAEVGLHFCDGDSGEKHFVEPSDLGNVVRWANRVLGEAHRPVTWIHVPVPIDRDDTGYVAALADLADVPELYLGLVHREDGAEGAQRRIGAARQVVRRDVGVATECGLGRAPEGTIEGILRTHAEVAAPW